MKWYTEKRKINDLIPYEHNPRQMTKKQNEDLTKSLEKFDLVEIPAINADGIILAGHQRLRIMQALGRGDEEIDVRVPDRQLTEKEVQEYNIRSNKNTGEFDFDILANAFETDDLLNWGFDENELKIEKEVEEDEVPCVDEVNEPKAKLGDIYKLGDHRLMCGDSTKIESVEKLMDGQKADCVVTDPPYNTGMIGKENKKARLSYMFKDAFTKEQYSQLLHDSFANMFQNTKGECAFYVFIDFRKMAQIKDNLEKIMDVKNVIVWDKGVHGLGSDYKFTYELCVVGKKGKPEINNRFGLDYQDIWRVQRTMGRNTDHATAKPIELLVKPIKHASKQDDIVLDLFGGSGSTLIACEQLNRKCYMMELDERYCDVIIKRWEDYTGKKAEKINE